MPPQVASTRTSDEFPPSAAVCPFCALLCDDLRLRNAGDRSFEIVRNGCKRASRDYARPPATFEPLINGQATHLESAVRAAAGILKRARQPLLAGLATDVDGVRAAVALAERCGGTLDHVHGEVLNAMAGVLQSRGGYTATLSEVRNRADFVLLVGVDLNDRYENFIRRCLQPKISLPAERARRRQVVHLGSVATAPDDPLIKRLTCRPAAMAETLLGLLASLKDAHLTARSFGGLSHNKLRSLADDMRQAAYCAVVFAPSAFSAQRQSAIATIFDIVDELNRTGRAAGLALGGDDGGQTAVSTCAWKTGYPLRVKFTRTVNYDPHGNATLKLINSGAVDGLLWIDAFGRNPEPPSGSDLSNTVILGAVKTGVASDAAAFIPVGTPGLDHFARLVRTDSVVSLPLRQVRDAGLPAVATVLSAIANRV